MNSHLLDGRLVSDSLLKEVSHEVQKLAKKSIKPKLVIILVGENPASLSYIRQKRLAAERTGIQEELERLSSKTTTQKLITLIEKFNKDKMVHGILVQLPLPPHMDAPLVIRAIDPMKDVDGFGAYNLGKMFLATEFENLAPCTPRGIIRMLEYYKISAAGKYAVIVGRSNIVGKPLAVMLINRDATVTICNSKTKNLADFTKRADILVAAVGKPKMITANMVKKGVIVIDVGVTKVENRLVGDVDFENVKRKASWLTPVPGGVGPMTVACLMENVVRAAKRISDFRPSSSRG
ncbi:MAG: bifunctional 5,10-methylenetetrahydrofolate dehydrogenase/5,10-methenyltetrahydrofolate cyclohydrolase [Patescibacteria group bacterium]